MNIVYGNSICRLCPVFNETIYYITLACPILAKEQHIKKHDGIYAQLHFYICTAIALQLDNERWYDHVPKEVVVTVK